MPLSVVVEQNLSSARLKSGVFEQPEVDEQHDVEAREGHQMAPVGGQAQVVESAERHVRQLPERVDDVLRETAEAHIGRDNSASRTPIDDAAEAVRVPEY